MLDNIFYFGKNWDWFSMFFYLVLALISLGTLYLANRITVSTSYRTKNKIDICVFFATFILLIPTILRNVTVGTDAKTYIDILKKVHVGEVTYDYLFTMYEPLYALYTIIISTVTDNYVIYWFLPYIIICYAYCKFIREFTVHSKLKYIYVLYIVPFIHNWSGLRSAVGNAFLLLSLVYWKENKKGKALLVTAVATGFHYTMCINFAYFLMLFLLEKYRMLKVFRRNIGVIGFVVTLMLSEGLKKIFSGTKYDYYLEHQGNYIGYWYVFLSFIFFFIMYKDVYAQLAKENNLVCIYALSFTLLLIPICKNLGAYRLPNYYILPRLVVFDGTLSAIKERFSKTDGDGQLWDIFYIIIVVFYFLFTITRAAESGGFVYNLGL